MSLEIGFLIVKKKFIPFNYEIYLCSVSHNIWSKFYFREISYYNNVGP